jgi:hypothetical protein
MGSFIPHNWYWLSDDGRLYSSRRQIITTEADEEYQAWLDAGQGAATIWPRDDDGEQTQASLQAVLDTFGNLFVDLIAYAKNARWRKEQGGIVVAGIPIATDDRSKQMVMGARIAADANGNFETLWATDADVVTLTAPQIIGISDAVLAHVQTCFVAFANVVAGINGGTITTREEIDAAFSAE